MSETSGSGNPSPALSGGPYVGFYAEAFRILCKTLTAQQVRLMTLMATYCDRRGQGWAGVRTLAEETGWRIERVDSVQQELEALDIIRWIRKHERDPITGRFQPNVYALNPHYVVVQEPKLAEWTNHLIRLHEKKRIITTIEPLQNHSINHFRNHDRTTAVTTSAPANVSTQPDPLLQAPNGDDEEQTRSPDEPQRQTAEQNKNTQSGDHARMRTPNPPVPRPPLAPTPPDLRGFAEPLSLPDDETLAMHLYLRVKTSKAWARYYVSSFGRRKVEAALRLLNAQKDEIENPAGWVFSQLRRGAISEDDDPIRDSFAQHGGD